MNKNEAWQPSKHIIEIYMYIKDWPQQVSDDHYVSMTVWEPEVKSMNDIDKKKAGE